MNRKIKAFTFVFVLLLVFVIAVEVKGQGQFVGSKNSDVYHYPSCRYVGNILEENKIWFEDAQDAVNQGYRPCKVCKPPLPESPEPTPEPVPDEIPPITSDDYDGLWHNSDFTITLTITDNESGVAETSYRINDGPIKTISTDGQPFIATESANNMLEYWSVDNAGNEELPHKTLTGIRLDKTVPMIETPSRIPENDVEPDQEVKVSVNVTDFLSAVKNVTLSYNLNDNALWIDLPMTLNSTTGLYEVIILGQQENTIVSYTIAAYDNAGNYKIENNSGQYYVYTIVPEFTPATLAIILIAVSTLAVALSKKLKKKT